MNEFTNFQRGLSETDFAWFKNETGLTLPPDVRAHYAQYNGGEPRDYLYVSDGTKYVVQEFFPIRYGKPGETVEDNYRELVRKDKLIPKGMMPFAIDPAGDFYCVDIPTGQVSIFRAEFLPNLMKCITPLAPSMSTFVAGLVEDVEAEE